MVAYLVLLCSSYSASINAQNLTTDGQILNTGNIVLPTNQGGPSSWVNGVYQNSLTCWTSGNPGYCGPNAIVRPGNNINFSFGMTDLYQSQAIANVLPDSGNGLRVNGYNFGFRAKNGNGWDDGRQDTLSAYVHFTNSSGQVTEYKSYDLNYKFNWTDFNFSGTFNTPYAAKDLGKVTYGFLGRDNNLWAGPYGPEVTNISFSLKYSTDPCAANVLSSPSCPGYLQAINSYSSSSPASSQGETAAQSSPTSNTTPTTLPSQLSPTTVAEAPVSTPPVSSSSNTSSPTAAVIATTTTSVTPSATNPQPRVGEVNVVGSQPSTARSTISTSQILSMIGSEQSRISKLEMSTVAAAVEQAKQEANKAVSEAQSIAAAQQAQTLASNQQLVSSFVSAGPQSLGSGLQVGNVQNSNIAVGSGFNFGNGTQQTNVSFNVATLQTVSTSFGSEVVSLTRRQEQESFRQQQVETRNINQSTNMTDPVNNIINPPTTLPALPPAPTGPAVNRNTQPNEAAGGRDINSIANTPAGFDAYSQLTLRDATFYKPYEIYRGQVNVDNARALRQLSTDRLHREMVDQQYK